MNLSEPQIEFIKEAFFNDAFFDTEKRGYAQIADILIREGQCIVAGNDQIWYGGIGNFLETSVCKGAVGCINLVFKREEFLKSLYFLERLDAKLHKLESEIKDLQFTRDELRYLKL